MNLKHDDNRIYIWMDWSSTPFWVPHEKDGVFLGNYDMYNELPVELANRFKTYAMWFDNNKPGWGDENNQMDWDLYDSYGKTLACDLKKLFPEMRIFYGHITNKDLIEIELRIRHEEFEETVCVSKKIDPVDYSKLEEI